MRAINLVSQPRSEASFRPPNRDDADRGWKPLLRWRAVSLGIPPKINPHRPVTQNKLRGGLGARPAGDPFRRPAPYSGPSDGSILFDVSTIGAAMFGVFKSKLLVDEQLGKFERVRGYWRGTIDLPPHGTLILLLAGSRTSPHSSAILAAHDLPTNYDQCREQLSEALFDHYQPYVEIREEVTEIEGSFPEITSVHEVWSSVSPQYVLVEGRGKTPVVEIALSVGWDPEHTLGARLVGDEMSELCPSIRRLVSWRDIEEFQLANQAS